MHPELKHGNLSTCDFSRILLVKPSSLGDVIHALPVLNGLRRRYPHAQIDWLVGSAFVPLLEGHAAISHLIPFDRSRYGRMLVNPRVGVEFLRFIKKLRSTRYDLVIDLQGLFRSGFITWATGARVRIGFQEAREGARYFYSHRMPSAPENRHAVDRNYAVASILGFADVPVAFPLTVSDAARESAARLLNGITADRSPLILIAPGARWDTKRWPADRFAHVIDALAVGGARCVLVGGRDEQDVCAGIASQCQAPLINLGGRSSLPELVALVDAADVVLCHDSAVAHIAVARTKPVVCITGPTNPARTGPYRGGAVVREPVECSPCYLRRISQCPHNHRCMNDLSVHRVQDAVSSALSVTADRFVARHVPGDQVQLCPVATDKDVGEQL